MKLQWKRLLFCLALPLAVGGLSAWLTQSGMETFEALQKPPLSPPGWVFPIVWSILFLMMGLASYLVWVSGGPAYGVRTALGIYLLQLAVNFFWSILFFGQGWYWFSFFWLLLLWVLILATLWQFYRISKAAGWLLVPYLLWVSFAGYLNLMIAILN